MYAKDSAAIGKDGFLKISQIFFPVRQKAAVETVVATKASNPTQLASYSNSCGSTSSYCLAAPGGDNDLGIVSTVDNNNLESLMGTSMATPVVSGSAAFLWGVYPNLKASDFRAEVINNTIKLEMAEGVLNAELKECVPTFMPEGYELEKSVIKEEYTLYTYAKDKNVYTISTIVTEVSDILTVSREFADVMILDCGVGFLNEKSLSFFHENLFVTIYNENFILEEATQIANSFVTE
jgi:subtilisin family serine protease